MKFYKQLIFILIIFLKTETVFSENNLFSVNNLILEKKDKVSNNELTELAIEKGFNQLIRRILLKKDSDKLIDLDFTSIKELVLYYQITDISKKKNEDQFVNFSITFDKSKIHNLFYKIGISYSDILNREIYILPVLIKGPEIFIFNNNYFYKNWNKLNQNNLAEFILPSESIEIIKNVNDFKNNITSLNLKKLFEGYLDKNVALIIIEDDIGKVKKVYIKSIVQGKKISKNLNFRTQNLNTSELYKKIIIDTKNELVNLVKSENLIDIRTPSFLNVKLDINKKNNLVELNSRVKDIDSIESIYVQEFNKNYVDLKIKYLGKLNKIINELKKEKIDLKLINDQWVIKTL
tara:strand:- start:855 stop:1901 length:1047 start_codon:yes stop_codon:yes gene_type:complete